VVEQNAGNQKSGEHKEEIDTAPSQTRSELKIGHDTLWFGNDLASEVMPNDNEENCDTSHTIELSYSFHL
jgi:hypothetical protein